MSITQFSFDYVEDTYFLEWYRACSTCRLRWNKVDSVQSEKSLFLRRSDLSELSFRVNVEHAPPLQQLPPDFPDVPPSGDEGVNDRPFGTFPDLFYEIKVSEC